MLPFTVKKARSWKFASVSKLQLGLSIRSFKSTAGLNIHFIGHNFDFIGQPVLRETGVNNSCGDEASALLYTDKTLLSGPMEAPYHAQIKSTVTFIALNI